MSIVKAKQVCSIASASILALGVVLGAVLQLSWSTLALMAWLSLALFGKRTMLDATTRLLREARGLWYQEDSDVSGGRAAFEDVIQPRRKLSFVRITVFHGEVYQPILEFGTHTQSVNLLAEVAFDELVLCWRACVTHDLDL